MTSKTIFYLGNFDASYDFVVRSIAHTATKHGLTWNDKRSRMPLRIYAGPVAAYVGGTH